MPRSATEATDNSWNVPITRGGITWSIGTLLAGGSAPNANYNEAFVAIGQFWFTMVIACIGGWLARWINAGRAVTGMRRHGDTRTR